MTENSHDRRLRTRLFDRGALTLAALVFAAWTGLSTGQLLADELRVSAGLVKVLDESEVSVMQAGVVSHLEFREGERVAKGDVLLRLDSGEAALATARAEHELSLAIKQVPVAAEIAAVERALRVAESDQARAEASRKKFKGSVTESEYDHLVLDVANARATLAKLIREKEMAEVAVLLRRRDLELAKLKLERHSVRATIDGVVIEPEGRVGEWVEPGQKIVRIIRTDRLKVEFFINVAARPVDLMGARAVFTVRGGGGSAATAEGVVTFVSPLADPVSNEARVSVEVDNADGKLNPGMKVSGVVHARP